MTSAAPATDPRDAELRELIARGEHERATEEALRAYGPELVGWLCSILPTELDEEDQTLLVLRVDRNLAWRDIAQVLLGEKARAAELTRKSTALRKQFERVKDRLRDLAARRLPD